MTALEEHLIDDEHARRRLDSRDTLRSLATAGAQVRQGIRLAAEAGVGQLSTADRPRLILVAATGGTGIVGDALETLAGPTAAIPVVVRPDGPLPGWVGALDLVVAVSQSGTAPGPLALAAEAGRRGASLLTIGAPDSPLADICARSRGRHVDVPSDRTSSRTALWSMLTPLLVAADRLGLVDVSDACLLEVADRLDEAATAYRPSSEAFVNPAKVLAADLADRIPVFLADGPLAGVAARRATTMLSRTARIPATWGELPSAAAAAVALLDGRFTDSGAAACAARAGAALGDTDAGHVHDDPTDSIFRDPYLDGAPDPRLAMVLVRDAPAVAGETGVVRQGHSELADLVAETARDAGVRVREITAGRGHPVSRLADLIAMVDFTATYLAIGLGLDPSVSPHVARLRASSRQ
ncbi:MAG: SIS domain-containing protein [Dermatophilaceae bacterium]